MSHLQLSSHQSPQPALPRWLCRLYSCNLRQRTIALKVLPGRVQRSSSGGRQPDAKCHQRGMGRGGGVSLTPSPSTSKRPWPLLIAYHSSNVWAHTGSIDSTRLFVVRPQQRQKHNPTLTGPLWGSSQGAPDFRAGGVINPSPIIGELRQRL